MLILETLLHRGWNLKLQTTKRGGLHRWAFSIQVGSSSYNYFEADSLEEINTYAKQFLPGIPGKHRYTEDMEFERKVYVPTPVNLATLL